MTTLWLLAISVGNEQAKLPGVVQPQLDLLATMPRETSV